MVYRETPRGGDWTCRAACVVLGVLVVAWIALGVGGAGGAGLIDTTPGTPGTALVQVKAIAGPSWQFDIRTFVDVRYTAGAQTMGQPTAPPAGALICVFVRLNKDGYGADRFYVLRWPELQRVLINGYRGYLKRHGGRRPRRADSFHTALREPDIKSFLDNWSLFDAFTEVSKTDPGTPGGPSAPH